MVMDPKSFGGVLDTIDEMPVEQQEEIIDIVRKRLRERERQQLIDDVREARAEHARGESKAVTVDELMREITS